MTYIIIHSSFILCLIITLVTSSLHVGLKDDDGHHLSSEMISQLHEVRSCFPLLYNITLPIVKERTYFPKNNAKPQRFRYICQRPNSLFPHFPKAQMPLSDNYANMSPTFLSSYNIDFQFLPEWVAFHIERPVFGVSSIPHNTRFDCKKHGGGKYVMVKHKQIITPDSTYMIDYNRRLVTVGKDPRDGIRKGQLCSSTFFLSCGEKEGAFAMTNVIPFNRYMYEMNWYFGINALRRYVTQDVEMPLKGTERQTLYTDKSYRSLYAVAGPFFEDVDVQRFDWTYRGYSMQQSVQTNRAVIPHYVWLAALDPKKLENEPEQAVIAWICSNRATIWPKRRTQDGLTYNQGPKMCECVSLKELKKRTGIVPFPDLTKKVINAPPQPAKFFLRTKF